MSRGEKQSLGWRPSEYTAFQTGQGYCYHLVDILGKVPLCIPLRSVILCKKVGVKNLFWALGSPLPHFGEGNGNPFQYSCLENPKDGGAW